MNLKSFALFTFLVTFSVTLLMGLLNLALELHLPFFKQVVLTTVVNVLVLLSPVVYEKLVGGKKVTG
jgi:accessory gene regulator protein AgrB